MKRKKGKNPRGPKRCIELDANWDRWMERYRERTHLSYKAIIQSGFMQLQAKNGGV